MATTHRTPSQPTPGAAPDLTSYRAIHDALRTANEQLVAGLDALPSAAPDPARAAALQRWFAGYRGELDGHHGVEDTLFFPALDARVPSFSDYAAALDADHHRTDDLVDAVAAALDRLVSGTGWTEARATAVAAAVDLRDLLARHLDTEDRDILPMFERHFTSEEYEELNQKALKAVPVRQAFFTAPWYMATVPPEVGARTLEEAPAALRVVYRLTRRRYARLVATAFGPAARPARTDGGRP